MRTAPKFLFELSEREARILLKYTILTPDAGNLRTRLLQFAQDCEQKPLNEEELDEISSWWKDTDATDLVVWNLPPGQLRRYYLKYMEEEDNTDYSREDKAEKANLERHNTKPE